MKLNRPVDARSPRGRPVGAYGVFALSILAATIALAAPREVSVSETVPRLGDHTMLSWREGPPYRTNVEPADAKSAGYSSERRFLRLATGYFAADFDTEKIAIVGFARRPMAAEESAVVSETLAAAPLPPARLRLEIQAGGLTYSCTGRLPLALNRRGQPDAPLEFPVRVIESGRFFQKFTLHNLEFRSVNGKRLRADARLEVSAWPNRLMLLLVVLPEESLASARIFLGLQAGADAEERSDTGAARWEERTEQRAVLALSTASDSLPNPNDIEVRVEPANPRGRATVRWNAEESAHVVQLDAPRWPAATEGNYPESMLDELESYAVTVENRSARPQEIGLNFNYLPARSIAGYVPMVIDARGLPSGLPVQISKDWHRTKPSEPLTYAGAWMHGRTWLNLPAKSRVAFNYCTTFARWGGVPTASLAQLSLAGWGHNGFWDQFALGSFGESICFQPARVIRRALLTDFRPLFQKGYTKEERWAWTGNVGGGDTMVRLDPQGRYVPFKRNVTRYASYGPNLAEVVYDEVSEDDAIHSRTEVFLPRSDDCLRVYLRLRYEVTRRVEFSRLAFFQLGGDFYNDTNAPLIAWGDASHLVAEQRPQPELGTRLLPTWEARGEQPWVSLHGESRADRAPGGQASRGLIVREWSATLGGRSMRAPFFAAVGSRGTKPHLAAEIVPPPDLTALEPGDYVDMLIEILPIPIAAERYYGPDKDFAAALREGANTWRVVQREATGNRPAITLPGGGDAQHWPFTLAVGATRELTFTLRGGLGWLPLRLTQLDRPDEIELWKMSLSGPERVQQGNPARAFWQADYDPSNVCWNLTYNVPATARPTTYMVRRRIAQSSLLAPAR